MTLTPEQLELRKNGIGASEIAAVAGVSPWDSPIDIYLRKVGEAVVEENEAMQLGHDLEPIICRRALLKLRARGVEVGDAIYGDTCVHPSEPWAMATPDYWVVAKPNNRALLECKSVGYRMIHHWDDAYEDDRGVPDYYLAQVQWQMLVCDADVTYVAALLGGRDLRVFDVRRDREVGDALLETGRRFWFDHVVARRPPPVDGSWGAERYLRSRFPTAKSVTLNAEGELLEAAEEMYEARKAMAAAKRRDDLASQRLRELMGEASVLRVGDDYVTWRGERSRIDWEAAARAAGVTDAEAERYRPAPHRVLRLPRAWGHE
jgi:putative phage-type endonuclease